MEYTPLLNWIKAACTLGITGLALIGQDPPQQPYPIPEALASKLKELLQCDILGLFAGPTPTGITQVASAVTTLMDHLVAAQSARELKEAQAKVKTPKDYYGAGSIGLLMRICQVNTVRRSPRLYHEVANTTKCTECMTIKEHLR